MAVVQAKNIHKSYYAKDILKGVNFTLDPGDKFALIGDNGTGKSTLMKILVGQEKADEGNISIASTATISYLSQHMDEFEDLDAEVLNTDELDRIQGEIQELSNQIAKADTAKRSSLLKEYQTLEELFERKGGYSYKSNLAQALDQLGINGEKLNRPIKTLSGGERMRVLMARKLLEQADVLFLDEPTNHLDIDGLEWLENFLHNYKGIILLISHDRYFIDKVCNQVGELIGGKLFLYSGNYTNYLEQKKIRTENIERTLQALEEDLERQQEVTQTLLSHRKMTSYHSREKVVARLEDQIEKIKSELPVESRKMRFNFMPREGKQDDKRLLLKLENASMSWDGVNTLFSDVHIEVNLTDKKVILGPNGSGKTTLLHMLMGKVQEFPGDLFITNDLKYGHLSQFTDFENEDLSILEEFIARTNFLETDARNTLAKFAFTGIDVYKQIRVLSGGERARLYLACLLEEKPDLLFLDEPTNHLDIHSREVLEQAISDFDGAVLAVSHDRYFVENCNFTVLGFQNKRLGEYRSFQSYRHFVHSNKQDQKKQITSSEPKQKNKNIEQSAKVNIGKLNKEYKELLKNFKSKEDAIHEMENRLAELEPRLEAENLYSEYASLMDEIEENYASFFVLGEKIEKLKAILDESF